MKGIREENKKLIEMIFKKGVERINRDIDIPAFKEKYCPNEDRTLELNIFGMDDIDSGFVIEGGKLRAYKRLTDTPTCRIWMDEDVFVSIRLGKITMMNAFWYGWLTIKGENYMRDLTIFQRMFDEHRETFIGK